MNHDDRFGELRSLLQQPASAQTWDALCDHLDLWPRDARSASRRGAGRLTTLDLSAATRIAYLYKTTSGPNSPFR